MNINRNNYEEYFLLYADNELSKTERKIVEIFVQENPDLKEEFSMWKLTINTPDEKVKLTDKSFLIKNQSSSFINENNYEEVFVHYHDNELSDEQKIETNEFIKQNPKYKTDFELIGKAKLTPDNSIVFPNKKQLYRKEKPGKIIPLMLWRSLAAAVFIGFGLWIVSSYYHKNKITPSVAVNTTNRIIKKAVTDTNNLHESQVKKEKNIAFSTKQTETKDIKRERRAIKKTALEVQKINSKTLVRNDVKVENSFLPPMINQPDTGAQITVENKPVKIMPAIVENNKAPVSTGSAPHADNTVPETQNTIPVQAASYVADASTKNENYVFYDVPAEEFRKSKIGGFLKKIRRVVERNNPINRLFAGNEEQVAAK